MPESERVAFKRQSGVVASQALVRFCQGLELPLSLEVRDFRALDINERLINGR